MKIGWFTPFGPRSAIGNYSAAAVAGLADGDEVTVFASEAPEDGDPRPSPMPVVRVPPHLSPSFLDALGQFDLLVYNMGDHAPNHRTIYEVATCRPGVVILHDVVLRDFFHAYCIEHRDRPDEFSRLMEYSHGPQGEADARKVRSSHRPDAILDPARLERPLFRPALRRCLGVLVHSEYALRRVAEVANAPAEKIDFPLFGPAARLASRPAAPEWPPDERVRLLTVGHVNPNKMVHATIQAIRDSDLLRERVSYTVIGNGSDESYCQDLQTLIRLHGLGRCVHLAGWCADEELMRALCGADVAINLRNPHFGESSASLLDSLVAGVPTVVWDHGFYAEFPADAVCKVASEAQLRPLLERLVGAAPRRRAGGRQGGAHPLARFDTGRYCEHFRDFADRALRHKPVLRLADNVSDRLLELGAGPTDGLAERLAAEVSFFAPDEKGAARPDRGPIPLFPRARVG